MFIFYDPETLKSNHIVAVAPPNYGEFLKTQPNLHWIETDETFSIEEIEILPDLTLRRRVPMQISVAHSRVDYETRMVDIPEYEIQVFGIPKGAIIYFDNQDAGIMDESGVMEFTTSIAGTYKLRFEASGYITKEISIEVGS
jgi:hypothetical protein